LHLISAHGYPKQYFFAVTNKGIVGLLQKYGSGASLLRGEWRERKSPAGAKGDDKDSDEDDEREEDESATRSAPQGKKPTTRDQPPHLQPQIIKPNRSRPISATLSTADGHPERAEISVDALADSINSLSLVPPSIRFGRGGKKGGFIGRPKENHGGRGRGRGRGGVGKGGIKTADKEETDEMPVSP